MIVLDTNLVSEAMRPEPNARVTAWLDGQAAETLYLSSVTVAELLFGVGALPPGRRRDGLGKALKGVISLFESRILPFDETAARRYAELAVRARAAGKGLPTPDGYIAAIAVSRGFAVATRDVGPFEAAGAEVIDPWSAARPG